MTLNYREVTADTPTSRLFSFKRVLMRPNRQSLSNAILLLALPSLLAFPGCSSATEVITAGRLAIVQGHLQSGAVGTLLPTPIVLRVLSTSGAPVAKVPISFSVIAGGGSVEPATVISDANGEGKTKWTLGPSGVNQSLSASAPGVDPITVGAVGVPPSDLVVAQGNNQSAKINTALPVAIVVRVTGGSGVPIPFATISMSITGGGGSVSPQSAVTNALGEVSVRWTLGPSTGLQTATVTAGSLGPITIVATAN